jgi:MoxR-like ATPase
MLTTKTSAPKPTAAIAAMQTIETEVNAMFLEREQAIRSLLVSFLAGQHCVLIGDPGTGKSALIEEICRRVTDPTTGNGLKYFSYLMTKFTSVDELFGPVSFPGMKNGSYERVLDGKLAEAEIAFLDEFWKSTSSVLNTMLRAINERRFMNGTREIELPLISVVAASNELPEGHELAPIRDRFLLTHFVNHLSRANRELLMLRKAGLEPDPWLAAKIVITRDDFLALSAYVKTIPFTRAVIAAKAEIIDELGRNGIIISERRDGQCQDLMQANALLDGRDEVTDEDLLILADALWMEPGQRQAVSRIVNQHSNPTNARAAELKDSADTIYNQTLAAMEANKQDRSKRLLAASEGAGKLEAIKQELETLQKSQKKPNKRIDQAVTSVSTQYAELLKSVGFKTV